MLDSNNRHCLGYCARLRRSRLFCFWLRSWLRQSAKIPEPSNPGCASPSPDTANTHNVWPRLHQQSRTTARSAWAPCAVCHLLTSRPTLCVGSVSPAAAPDAAIPRRRCAAPIWISEARCTAAPAPSSSSLGFSWRLPWRRRCTGVRVQAAQRPATQPSVNVRTATSAKMTQHSQKNAVSKLSVRNAAHAPPPEGDIRLWVPGLTGGASARLPFLTACRSVLQIACSPLVMHYASIMHVIVGGRILRAFAY